MTNWTTVLERSWNVQESDAPVSIVARFQVHENTQRIRFRCRRTPSLKTVDKDGIESFFQQYAQHSGVSDEQREAVFESFSPFFTNSDKFAPAVLLMDPSDTFRGRWDPSFSGWKEIGLHDSSDGFKNGDIPPGEWSIVIYSYAQVIKNETLSVEIGVSAVAPESTVQSELIPIQEEIVNEVNLAWYVGELHEHTLKGSGSKTPEDTISTYTELGYTFLTLTDHDVPPLSELYVEPDLSLIRGQEIQWNFGHALLIGVHDWFPPNPSESPEHLDDIIHDVHVCGGLFCVVHPFAQRMDVPKPSWNLPSTNWGLIDLLEIWPGRCSQRFPEILKTFDLWDRLLNQGIRIFGTCGKGSHLPADKDVLERSPKTLVLSEGQSETQILAALKQGHFYSTTEPAVTVYVESEHGGGYMGDELRLPVRADFLLRVEISQLERAFLRIKTNKGVYCEMPASSVHETKLKFYEHAAPGVQWFRVEVYRYNRPIDELLAFSNPVFVRGMMSV